MQGLSGGRSNIFFAHRLSDYRVRRRGARGRGAAAAADGCDGAPIEAARARPRPGLMCQELWGAGAPL
jgi:hypothetical protein